MAADGRQYSAILQRIRRETERNRLDVIHLMQANQTEVSIRDTLDRAVSSMDETLRAIDAFFNTSLGRVWK